MSVRRVQPGSIVDVVAPAGPFDAAKFREGVALLESHGLKPRFRDDLFARDRFLAGSDDRRLTELIDAIRAPDSDLVWAARGGYGSTRLLDEIELEDLRRANKLLVGFSDLTALHLRWRAAGVPSIHGSMVARLSSEPTNVLDRLFDMLLTAAPARALRGRALVPGCAQGKLTGGNLALLAALCGTPYQHKFDSEILFLEDIGERPYRLDRMLTQLRQAGVFDRIAALAFGEFVDCEEKDGTSSRAGVLAEHARKLGVPCLADLPCGHGEINQALPFGVRVRLDAGELTFLESPFDAEYA